MADPNRYRSHDLARYHASTARNNTTTPAVAVIADRTAYDVR